MPKHIVLLTYYFAPDFSAGAFRMEALAQALMARAGPGTRLDVVTAQPNRYGGVAAQEGFSDALLGCAIHVHRIDVRPWFRSKGSQLQGFARFALAAGKLVRDLKPDLLVASTSRLGTGWLGARLARDVGVRFHLDLRDLFPDSVKHLLPGFAADAAYPVLQRMQGSMVAQASSISVTSPLYAEYLHRHYGHRCLRFVPNGIDRLFLDHEFTVTPRATGEAPLRVVYAGNIGYGQGLHDVLPELAAATRGRVQWRLVGAGNALPRLERALAARKADNVELLPPVPREQLLAHYDWADALFLHLSASRATRRVVPSKVFEYGATGKPVLAGVAGFTRRFIEENVPGAVCFAPADEGAAVAALHRLESAAGDKAGFRRAFERQRLMTQLADFILTPGAAAGAERRVSLPRMVRDAVPIEEDAAT